MTRTLAIGIVAALLLVGTAQAIVLDGTKDSVDFDNGYEAEALPADSTPVWRAEGWVSQTVSDGILRIYQSIPGHYRRYWLEDPTAYCRSEYAKCCDASGLCHARKEG